jgi:hypothetical protein
VRATPDAPPPAPQPERRAAKPPAAEAQKQEQREAESVAAQARAEGEPHALAEQKVEAANRARLQAQEAAGAAAPSASTDMVRPDPYESAAKRESERRGLRLPPGWYLLGNAASRYEAAMDESAFHTPPNSLALWRKAAGADGCGRLQAEVPATGFRGKEVRVRALARGEGVQESNAWLFVSYARGGPVDWPMPSERFQPAETWQPREARTVVPGDADRVVYGAMLCGVGTLWIDNVELRVVE